MHGAHEQTGLVLYRENLMIRLQKTRCVCLVGPSLCCLLLLGEVALAADFKVGDKVTATVGRYGDGVVVEVLPHNRYKVDFKAGRYAGRTWPMPGNWLKKLESAYEYEIRIGFSYTFGSIFNSAVNPRLQSGGGGGMDRFRR